MRSDDQLLMDKEELYQFDNKAKYDYKRIRLRMCIKRR